MKEEKIHKLLEENKRYYPINHKNGKFYTIHSIKNEKKRIININIQVLQMNGVQC